MLMSLMRKHAKSWLIKFLIGIIAIVFIFYFGYSATSRQGIKIAYVNGDLISEIEYQKAYRNLLNELQRDYKSVWSDNLIKVFDLKNRALESVIKQKLVSQEARRVGLDITEKEIQNEIIVYPAFQFKGRFDESRYRSLLQHNRMKPEDFEASIAQEMLQKKLSQFLMSFLPVTGQEVLDFYTFSHRKVKISFVQFLPENFKKSIKLDETSLEKYFDKHIEEYRIPEKIKIAYIIIEPGTFKSEIAVTDREINEYYEDNIENYREKKQVKARHILFKLDENASGEDEKKVREKATSVLKKARKGEDFKELAKKHSEGPSKDKGGDLGYFSRGQMVKQFEDAVFKMKKGEIGEPVRTPFGYHIIKLEDVKEARTKPFEEVREQITELLIDMESIDLAHGKALSLIDQMPYDVDLKQYGASHNVPVKQSDYFSQNEPIPDIIGDDNLRQSIFSLQKNDVSELLEFDSKFYIIQVVEKKPSHLPKMDEVHDALKEHFISYLSAGEAKSAAEEYLNKLKEDKDWEELAKEHHFTPETTGFFTRNDFIPQIGNNPELKEAVFGLDQDRRYPDRVFENKKGVFVIRWEGQEGIDEEKYSEDKEKFRHSLMLAKHKGILGGWLEDLKNKAEIEIITPVDRK